MTELLTIGKRIALIRKRNKFSQQELARILGVSRSLIGLIETDKSKPNYVFLKKIVSITNTTYNFLIEGESDISRSQASSENLNPIKEEKLSNDYQLLEHLFKCYEVIVKLRLEKSMTDQEIRVFENMITHAIDLMKTNNKQKDKIIQMFSELDQLKQKSD